MKLLFIYLIVINATGLIIMLADKHYAVNNLRRIPERSLLAVAVLGGSLGCMSGMYLFRHKTRHLKFSLGLPILFAFHFLALLLLLYRQLGA